MGAPLSTGDRYRYVVFPAAATAARPPLDLGRRGGRACEGASARATDEDGFPAWPFDRAGLGARQDCLATLGWGVPACLRRGAAP